MSWHIRVIDVLALISYAISAKLTSPIFGSVDLTLFRHLIINYTVCIAANSCNPTHAATLPVRLSNHPFFNNLNK